MPPAASSSGSTSPPPKTTTSHGDIPAKSEEAEPDTGDPPPLTLARPFRSRKNRPCDGCRRAKTRCAITEAGKPCVECQQTRKKCTFDEQPRERKKPAKRPSSLLEPASEERTIDAAQRHPAASTSFAGTPAPKRQKTEASSSRTQNSLEVNVAETPGLGYHVITSVLTDDLLPMGRIEGEGEYIRQISADGSKPQYIIFHRWSSKQKQPAPLDALIDTRLALSILNPLPPDERTLADIYLSTSNAAFPFLPPFEHQWQSVPSLYSEVLISSLNHSSGGAHRPHVRSTRKIASRGNYPLQRSHNIHGRETTARNSSLTVITDALFALSARPSLSAEENYLLLARTIAEAQLLGLHVDPANWALPEWEKDYRRLLWWCLRVHDAWASFLNARPSHIQTNNHNVPVPSLASIQAIAQPNKPPPKHHSYQWLCQLAILVSRLQTQVCTLMTQKEERLGRVAQIEKDAAALLVEVQSQGQGLAVIPGYVSLMTCLMGFRCMIRRIVIELSIGLGSPFTPDPDTLELYANAVEYVSTLDGAAFNSFWLTHCGHILSSMMSSLIRLSLATTSTNSSAASPRSANSSSPLHGGATSNTRDMNLQDYPKHQPQAYLRADSRTNPVFLLRRLRRVLQRARDEYNWDIGEAALARADRVAACLEPGGEEFETVVQALRGEYSAYESVPLPESTSPSPVGSAAPMYSSNALPPMVTMPSDSQMQQPRPRQQQMYDHSRSQQQHPQHYHRMDDGGMAAQTQQQQQSAMGHWNIDFNVFGGLNLGPWVGQQNALAPGGLQGLGVWGDTSNGGYMSNPQQQQQHHYPGVNGHHDPHLGGPMDL